jgi:hypothetical protein
VQERTVAACSTTTYPFDQLLNSYDSLVLEALCNAA